jgi:thymidine phosphorylase
LLTEVIIQRKRDGASLSMGEIRSVVNGIIDGSVSDCQIAALAMAIYFQGLSVKEQSELTLAMRDSGTVLEWPGLNGPVLDKHSTGGVGDLVSLILAPLVAVCGAYVPMVSGRALGHTGGTVDKLESVPGINMYPSIDRFKKQVHRVGVAVVGQSEQLAPADRRIYAVRDTTATVSSPPLIVSSILSKKLAEGLDGLVMDIKFGNGAFLKELPQANAMAEELARVSREAGTPCHCLITDMNQPLASCAGNSLEVLEAIDFLMGNHRTQRLLRIVLELGVEMLMIGGLSSTRNEAYVLLQDRLDSGAGAEKFAEMIAFQGGPKDILENKNTILPGAQFVRPVFSDRGGYVSAIDTRAVGFSVVQLGGGRRRPGDPIDPSVGFSRLLSIGVRVGKDTPLAFIHADNETDWSLAAQRLVSAYTISRLAPEPRSVIPGGSETSGFEGSSNSFNPVDGSDS